MFELVIARGGDGGNGAGGGGGGGGGFGLSVIPPYLNNALR